MCALWRVKCLHTTARARSVVREKFSASLSRKDVRGNRQSGASLYVARAQYQCVESVGCLPSCMDSTLEDLVVSRIVFV